MISVANVTKILGKSVILENVNAHMENGAIYGLLGTNGAGKSTLLNVMSGVYRPEKGSVLYDGCSVWENTRVKRKIAYVSDEPYFFNGYTLLEMAKYYCAVEPEFTMDKFQEMLKHFPLDAKKKINTYSKGMKRQAAFLLALSKSPDVLLLDESFDGLDPVIRQLVKRLIIDEQQARGMTTVVSSHNLREMENLCDVVAVLHEKSMLFERSVNEIKDSVHKYQMAFDTPQEESAFASLSPLSVVCRGRVTELVMRGDENEVLAKLNATAPLFAETIPLDLEDIFIYEMEATGYDFSKLI